MRLYSSKIGITAYPLIDSEAFEATEYGTYFNMNGGANDGVSIGRNGIQHVKWNFYTYLSNNEYYSPKLQNSIGLFVPRKQISS